MGLLDRLKNTPGDPYDNVDVDAACTLVAAGALLLDVRSDSEWAAGHAHDAVHLELFKVAERGAHIAGDRHVVTACRSGGRSSVAAKVLAEQGVPVSNLRGGMSAWARSGQPVVKDSGRTGSVI